MKITFFRCKSLIFALAFAWSRTALCAEHGEHNHDHGANPLLTYLEIDKFEQQSQDSTQSLDGQAWVGKDLHKLWFKSELNRTEGAIDESEIQALYSYGFSAYWDVQIGLRHAIKPKASNWLALGVQGLAPYWFDVEASVFVGSANEIAARIKAQHELHFTQRLILTPEMEINAYGQNDPQAKTGSGLADFAAGLRLGYEISRKFVPYLGISWEKKFGNTADFIDDHESDERVSGVIGLHLWF